MAAKLDAAAAAGDRLLRCEQRFPLQGRPYLRCQRRVRAAFRLRLELAEAAAGESGYACPGTPESLGIDGGGHWPQVVMQELVLANPAESQCTRQRLAALRQFSKAASYCRLRLLMDHTPQAMSTCVEEPHQRLLEDWALIAARAGDCTSDLPAADVLVTRLREEVEAQARRLIPRCGDRRIAGFEECDDGDTASLDGCTSDCRLEQCERIQGSVLCEPCPSDAIVDPETAECRCPDGYEGEPGACTDIDECAEDQGGCPAERPCVNLPGTYSCSIQCTSEALHEALASCGAPTGAIAFDCQNKVVSVERSFIDDPRRVACDNLVIDGTDRNITFVMDPLCWQVQLTQDRCRTTLEPDGTCACPDVDTGTPFLILDGDHNTVRNLTVRGFFDGVRSEGSFNVVENMRFERMCDDAFGAVGTGTGNVFRDLEAFDGCDKCSQSDGDLNTTDSDARVPGHYSAIYENVYLEDCNTPIRLSSGGRFRIRGVTMTSSPDPLFTCDGPRFSGMSGDELVVEMDSSLVEQCRRGIRFGILSEGLLWNNLIRDNALRGVWVGGDAEVSLWDNEIRDNGGDASNELGFGGVAVMGSASADLGGGDLHIDGRDVVSPGGNSICGNLDLKALPLELENGTETVVPAEQNWWCTIDSPAGLILGSADFSPYLKRAP